MSEVIWEKDPNAPGPGKRYVLRIWKENIPGTQYEYRWKWLAIWKAKSWTSAGYRVRVIDTEPDAY